MFLKAFAGPHKIVVLATALLIFGCTSVDPAPGDKVKDASQATAQNAGADQEKAKDDGLAESENHIDEVMVSVDNQVEDQDEEPSEQEDEKDVGDEISHATTEKLPLVINADVQRWIDYFTTKNRERFQRFLERGEKYKPMVSAVLREQGIPTEIFYQAMIESGFATQARSHAAAVGIWQFIRGTGHRYGLRVDNYVDERRDPMRSTIAAAIYLKDLYNVFQSWYLAIAAYNAGEGRIMNAIMKAKTRDFWTMVKMGALPEETMQYIPKFLAATIIGHDPAKYGFDDLKSEIMPMLVSVSVPSPVRLSDVARVTEIPLAALKEFNPQLLRGMTPPGRPTYRIWVAKDQAEGVEDRIDELAALRLKGARAVVQTGGSGHGSRPHYYTVVAGDTLARVANRYGMSVRQVKRINHLRSHLIRPGMKLVLWETSKTRTKRYRVQRGDNLGAIARRFGVRIEDLRRLNRLKRNRVYAGQLLKIIVAEQKG